MYVESFFSFFFITLGTLANLHIVDPFIQGWTMIYGLR